MTPRWQNQPSLISKERLLPIVLAGLALSVLMWPTFSWLSRIGRTGGVIVVVAGDSDSSGQQFSGNRRP